MMTDQQKILSLIDTMGYTSEFDDSGLDCTLTPQEVDFPPAEIHFPDEDETGIDCRLEICSCDETISREVLLFINRFNWEYAFGKIICNPYEKRICFQRYFTQDPAQIDPETFALDFMMSSCYVSCLKQIIPLVAEEKLSESEAAEELEAMFEDIISGCTCGDDGDCDCGCSDD